MSATTHIHTHDHDHTHDHVHEAGTPPSGGPVVVDIGGDVGALVVHLDRELLGTELHLRQAGWDHTVHTGVWDRPLGERMLTVAVYPTLVMGTYEVLAGSGAVRATVDIEGGAVAELDLRT